MREQVLDIFTLLDKTEVRYLLLRPLNFSKGFNDIDIVIDKGDLNLMYETLKNEKYTVRFQKTNSNVSIKLYVNDLVFDLQFYICFLPYKSLIIKKTPPFGSVKNVNDLLFPTIKDEALFTLWTHRLLLDKDIISYSGSFETYYSQFNHNWKSLIYSDFYKKWTTLIYGIDKEQILAKYICDLFDKKIKNKDILHLRSIVVKNNKSLRNKIFFDKIKYKTLRRLGVYK